MEWNCGMISDLGANGLRKSKDPGAAAMLETASVKPTAPFKIVETAKHLFYLRGIRAVGVDEIVCAAGVAKPSLYRTFKSKDARVAASLRQAALEDCAAMDLATAAAGSDPRQRLAAVLHYYDSRLDDPDFRGCMMSNTAVEICEPRHPGRQVVKEYSRRCGGGSSSSLKIWARSPPRGWPMDS